VTVPDLEDGTWGEKTLLGAKAKLLAFLDYVFPRKHSMNEVPKHS
jgi:hypothetical protein